MALRFTEYDDPLAFADAVQERLMQAEVENCVQLGLLDRLRGGYSPRSDDLSRPNLWTIDDGERIDLVAMQTLKKWMLLTRGSTAAMQLLADELVARGWTGRAVIGIPPSIHALAERYESLAARQRRLAVQLRSFQLDRVVWPPQASGEMRACESRDCETLIRFAVGFARDINEPAEHAGMADRAKQLIDRRQAFFWFDREPVAVAALTGPTPNGIRVSLVYTPREFRGRGYASNLVARLSQHALDTGRKCCFLFTDQANPVSNSIYQKIGYRPVADSERWEFSG